MDGFARGSWNEDVPCFEQLEQRVLLSANPFTELAAHNPDPLQSGDSAAAVYMPAVAGQSGDGATSLSAGIAEDGVLPSVAIECDALSAIRPGQAATVAVTANGGKEIVASFLYLGVDGEETAVELDAEGKGHVVFPEDGDYTLRAVTIDADGHMATASENISISPASQAELPTVTIHSPVDNGYAGGNVEVWATIDIPEGVTATWTVNVRYNGALWERAAGSGSVDNGCVARFTANSFNLNPIPQTIEIHVTDSNGNTVVAVHNVTFTRNPPRVDLQVGWDFVDINSTRWINKSQEVTGKILSADVPIDQVSWTLTAVNNWTGEREVISTGRGQPVDGVFGIFAPTSSANYTIILDYVDSAGMSGKVELFNRWVDVMPPSAVRVDYYTEGFTLMIKVEGRDDLNVVRNDIWDMETGLGSGTNCNIWGGKMFSPYQVGKIYKFRLTVSDYHGNTTPEGIFTVQITESGLLVKYTPS